jgi:hypothetical protein
VEIFDVTYEENSFEIKYPVLKSGICVEKCPKEAKEDLKCQNSKKCPPKESVYKTRELLRYCMPSDVDSL